MSDERDVRIDVSRDGSRDGSTGGSPDRWPELGISDAEAELGPEARAAFYQLVALRRDVRHFVPDQPVSPEALGRILAAAHQAPSVGLSQPWRFVIVRDRARRDRIRENFLRCRAAEASRFSPERRASYLAHRLEGIVESSLNVCVVADLRERNGVVLGTTVQPESLRASVVCAVQNLWLAARAEGLGVGWVSIVEPAVLRRELMLPAETDPVAYLCLGTPAAFRRHPMLEETGWSKRLPLAAVVMNERWSEDLPTPRTGSESPAVRQHAPAPDEAVAGAARAHQARLIKPPGSLGRLESLAVQYAAARAVFPPPPVRRARVVVFAADHGVAAEGVSAYTSAATAAVFTAIAAGGGAINAIAEANQVDVLLVDVGVAGDLSRLPREPLVRVWRRPVVAGTRSLADGAALAPDELARALEVGRAAARASVDDEVDAVGVGEIGIANTTSAAALIAALTGGSAEAAVGVGTGVDADTRRRKVAVVEAALAIYGDQGPVRDPRRALQALGGAEIAALVGFIGACAEARVPVVLDGVVTNAAALVAVALDPNVRGYLVASHRSPEPGAGIALEALGLLPLLELGLRAGEGTGAALGLGLLRAAVAAQGQMATFATAGRRSGG